VCTVPVGRIQVEAAAYDWSLTRSAGTRADLLTVGATYLKLGVSDASDVEIGLTPYAASTTRGGSGSRISGIGDVVLRYKQRLTPPDAPVQLGFIPFVKLPAATHGLGNGKLEGGVALPVSFTLLRQVTMTFGPELDALADSHGRSRHFELVSVVNVSAPIAPRLSLSGELWSNVNFEPGGTIKQASADAALAYALAKRAQLDIGANFGLTRATPDIESYVGVSLRF
jgi:hypothetical protein